MLKGEKKEKALCGVCFRCVNHTSNTWGMKCCLKGRMGEALSNECVLSGRGARGCLHGLGEKTFCGCHCLTWAGWVMNMSPLSLLSSDYPSPYLVSSSYSLMHDITSLTSIPSVYSDTFFFPFLVLVCTKLHLLKRNTKMFVALRGPRLLIACWQWPLYPAIKPDKAFRADLKAWTCVLKAVLVKELETIMVSVGCWGNSAKSKHIWLLLWPLSSHTRQVNLSLTRYTNWIKLLSV